MAEPGVAYLTIGEVLGLLLEEFPDVTISKIRFLESQGLIEPERTPSGYRKFLEHDVDLLRVILREQRQNFLPLRVIKDRIHSGEIDRTGTPPRGVEAPTDDVGAEPPDDGDDGPSPAVIAAHPAGRRQAAGRSAAPGAPPRVPVGRADHVDAAERAGQRPRAPRRLDCCQAWSSTATSCVRWRR